MASARRFDWMMRAAVLAVAILSSSLSSAANVLGKLGQAVQNVRIHASPNSKSRLFYTAKQFQYLVVTPGPKSWVKVLMANGVFGYAKSDFVAVLPYDVTPKTQSPKRDSAVNMSSRSAMANYALKFTGTPYKWGGNDLNNGIDCSAFVQKLYGMIGTNLPRTAAEQARKGTPITRMEDLQVGDRLYFWEKRRNKIGHTGIYLGNGYFVHSSSGKGGVSTDYLGAEKWRRILVAARR